MNRKNFPQNEYRQPVWGTVLHLLGVCLTTFVCVPILGMAMGYTMTTNMILVGVACLLEIALQVAERWQIGPYRYAECIMDASMAILVMAVIYQEFSKAC